MTTIGTKLQAARQAKQLTQQQVADALHVTRQTISGWETGRTYPDIDSLIHLCDLFELSLDALLREDQAYVTDLTRQTQALKRARQSFWAAQASAVLIALLFLGDLLHWPGMALPQLSLSLIVILMGMTVITGQALRQTYWHLARPRVLALSWRLLLAGGAWVAFALGFLWLNGLTLISLTTVGSGTVVAVIVTVHALRHPEENHPQ